MGALPMLHLLLPILAMLTFPMTQLKPVAAQRLYADSRWIVDETGRRVKLTCVNWPAHLKPLLAEGLSERPADAIAKKIREMGFNCVRLTWALELPMNETLASLTVERSFQNLGLSEALVGIKSNNPSLVNLPLMEAYKSMMTSLRNNKVMVILDNHLTTPGWCCSADDGNGFFGDKYFDPQVWIQGLHKMATMATGFSNVIGMSLRNELRGPRQNVDDWYKYMQEGAKTVHAANPNVLVILSGLNYDKDLSFLRNRPVSLSFTKKLVFEMHWYGFTNGQAWQSGNPNDVCGAVSNDVMGQSMFLLEQGYPLFVSEFGIDERGINVNDNRYFNCFMAMAAEFDWDSALWSLQGSYYLRQGVVGMEEYYGLFNYDWSGVRNSTFLRRISALQSPFQGPGGKPTVAHKVIFHPLTGLCILRRSRSSLLVLGPCEYSEPWNYTPQNALQLVGKLLYLRAVELGSPASLGMTPTDPGVKWEMISASRMHLSSKARDGSTVCLGVSAGNTVVVEACKCLSDDSSCDPASQWFKLVDRTRL
ncbi:glycosyl hydrolase 5 family protein-like [Rhodamnia argentea]|uniref:Glycosyl hydrolase 5 family protein-like n=1 Tax=Rhodamnia argentea TaxID=178133 RepID=A0A8B8QD15_9MYRT|nr:glycosyl hydrolase 5 family protein-like [Rhodamnia argentea]